MKNGSDSALRICHSSGPAGPTELILIRNQHEVRRSPRLCPRTSAPRPQGGKEAVMPTAGSPSLRRLPRLPKRSPDCKGETGPLRFKFEFSKSEIRNKFKRRKIQIPGESKDRIEQEVTEKTEITEAGKTSVSSVSSCSNSSSSARVREIPEVNCWELGRFIGVFLVSNLGFVSDFEFRISEPNRRCPAPLSSMEPPARRVPAPSSRLVSGQKFWQRGLILFMR